MMSCRSVDRVEQRDATRLDFCMSRAGSTWHAASMQHRGEGTTRTASCMSGVAVDKLPRRMCSTHALFSSFTGKSGSAAAGSVLPLARPTVVLAGTDVAAFLNS